MKKTFLLFTVIMYCFMGIGFCADKVVVIPFFSEEKCTGDVISEDVLSGKTFSNSTGKGITGTMPNKGSLSFTPKTTNIPIYQGFYDGTGYVEGDPDLVPGNIKNGAQIFGVAGDSNVVDTTEGDAVSDDILADKKAYADGVLIIGTMPKVSPQDITPSTTEQIIIQGYHHGTGKVLGDSDLVSGNIKSGSTIFGVEGDSNIVNTFEGDAVSSDILTGKKAYVGGQLVTGNVSSGTNVNGADGSKSFTIPDGLYTSSKTATALDSNLTAEKIKDGVTIFGVEGTFPSDGTAVEAEVKTGSTFYTTSGTKLTGSGTKTLTDTNDSVAEGYYNATTLSEVDTNLTAENIKYGVTIFGVTGTNRIHKCGAYITATVWKLFDCYNLAAIGQTTNDDPFTPSWRLIGGYWQWGRKGPDSSQWHTTNTANFAHGPTGPDAGDANAGSIGGWDTTDAPDGSWSDASKIIANDPCTAGYRVPTKAQWDGAMANNIQSVTGSWSNSATNYSSARFFGDDLMLPAASYRDYINGALDYRGYYGFYWSSTQYPSYDAWSLYFSSSTASSDHSYLRRLGFSVRCVAE